MTEEQLEKLVDELNTDPGSSKFILTQIDVDIYFGTVWFNLPWENQTEYRGDKYYFINRLDCGFIGAVEATNSEMHAYLKPNFRGNGIMSTALRETILPHSFWYNQSEKCRVTIDQNFHKKRFEEIEKSALLAGFKDKNAIVDHLYEYFAYKVDYPEFTKTEGISNLVTEKEFRFLHDRINTINAQLQYMKERYEILFHEEDKLVSSIIADIEQFEFRYDDKIRTIL
jgi:hypothetical protein